MKSLRWADKETPGESIYERVYFRVSGGLNKYFKKDNSPSKKGSGNHLDVPENEMLVQPHQPHSENPAPKIVKMTKIQKTPAEIVKINQNLEIETSSQSGSDYSSNYSQRPLPTIPSHQKNLPSTSQPPQTQSGQNHQKKVGTSQDYTKVNKPKLTSPKISICDDDGCRVFFNPRN